MTPGPDCWPVALQELRDGNTDLSILRRFGDALQDVIWFAALDPEEVLYVSPSFERVWGVSAEALGRDSRRWARSIHSDDRARIEDTFSRWIAGEDVSYGDVEYRIIQPGGATRWIHECGVRFRHERHPPYQVCRVSTDVTDAREAQLALEKALAEIGVLTDQVLRENVVLRQEVARAPTFEEIVGVSPALRAVLDDIARVAPTSSTVLIIGETGTGKELVARAIHRRSARAARPFVSVNCAAVPASLIASELFGHEKGAFTGAVQRREGRFELAAGGTIFLDEVADLPAETQVALLRVLQEREFERVGGTRSIPADVRVITATNRDLDTAVGQGAFRIDLFYRLNVFPLELPPLRERRSDIPLLAEHFVQRFAVREGKRIRAITKHTLDALQAYDWPGNIRELQNVIERAVVVCEGPTLSVDGRWLSRGTAKHEPPSLLLHTTFLTHERGFIESALSESKGRVAGPFGAASKLGMPPSTLESKIKTLHIDKQRFKATD
jgi:PAS domain S-box-containing protein